MDENKTPAQQAPDTAAPETANIEATTQPETAPAPEVMKYIKKYHNYGTIITQKIRKKGLLF